MNVKQYEIDDPTFVSDLLASDNHVAKIQQWLLSKGHHVTKPKISIRDKVENMSDFSDTGDLFLYQNQQVLRLEIKQRMLNFSDKIVFPYPTIIVDAAHCWDNANPKPYLYILTNKEISWCYFVKGETSAQWIRKRKWDKQKNRYRDFLECPISLAKLYQISSQSSYTSEAHA